MAIIPGKYLDAQGGEATVIAGAKHGLTGETAVIYRTADGGLRVLSEKDWAALNFTYAADIELKNYLSGESRAELAKRFSDLFQSRDGIYSVHWRSVIGTEGYNYACENQGKANGCRRGIDNCKNCRSLFPRYFDSDAAARHLSGDMTVGIYPIFPDGTCRFLVFGPLSRDEAEPLREVCRDFDLPACCEAAGKKLRLWLFFAERIPLPHLRRLGRALVTLAMERSEAVGFDMYDRFIPCRDEILPEDMGFELPLPFGRSGRETGAFVDESYAPLPHGPAELFRLRTVTRGYLSDRLNLLNAAGGEPRPHALSLPEGIALAAAFDGDLAISKAGLSHGVLLTLRRLACVKNPELPYGEFEPLTPCFSPCFTEDKDVIRLPRGLRRDLERTVRAAGGEITYTDTSFDCEAVYFSLARPVTGAQLEAATALSSGGEGILTARLGWGKTGAAAKLIELKRRRTLIIVPDDPSRDRWVRNVMDWLGVDAQRGAAQIQVRTADDRRIKGKYGLVLLADCSRLPMNGEIFARIRDLKPEFIYGITASDRRRDGKWGFIHMLCGPVVYEG